MKITLKDFGPISHFEFDLDKDLHVIFGKNNIGKSYAITVVYLILKNLMQPNVSFINIERHLYSDENNELNKQYKPELKNLIVSNETILGLKSNDDITNQIEPILSSLVRTIFVENLENSLKNSYSSIQALSNTFSGNRFEMEIETPIFIISISSDNNTLKLNSVKIRKAITIKPHIEDIATPYLISWENRLLKLDYPSFAVYLYQQCSIQVYGTVNNVYFLPSSRSGLYQALNTFSAVFVELSKSRNFLTNKVELPNISEPVSDYFLNLSNINNESDFFSDIVESFEINILNGKVIFNNENKKLYFIQNGMSAPLDLSFTSSMVSEIAPIVAYLKFIIGNTPNSLIFIEEPEAHLHPEVQVKLMEMFAMLAGKNIKIVMTSHSNYMFNKLSNLLLDDKIDHNKVASYLMRPTDKGTVTDMLSMKAEEDGINDENFADTAAMLYEERIKIYERLNQNAAHVD